MRTTLLHKLTLGLFALAPAIAGCGTSGGEPEAIQCESFAASEYEEDSGWGAASYCPEPSDLGCFPYHGSAADSCGPFVSMRTSATSQDKVDACRQTAELLNCATFTDNAGTTLSFFVEEPDRFEVRVTGTYDSAPVDTMLYLNPCHEGCLAAITLETIEPAQQKLCEIPRQGKPVCMFPETAHSVTIARIDSVSMELRMAGKSSGLSRIADD